MTASSSFIFQPTGIGAMLKQGHLIVPPNQRSYAWRERHVEVLLKDLWSAMSGTKQADYFLGTIVLIQSSGNSLTIVDGQQRLATVSIIFARIRDYFTLLKREGSARSVQETFIGHIDPRSEQVAPRLHLNDDDNDFFWNVILLPSRPADKPLEWTGSPLRPSHRRMLRASEKARTHIGDILKPLNIEDRINILLRWYDFLDSNAHVLSATVADEEAAYRLFETLNDRGLRASQADILKNFFFSKSGLRLSEAKTMWARMVSAIEVPVDDRDEDDSDNEEGPTRGDPLLTYVRHSWITTHGHTRVKDLSMEIRKEVTIDTRAIQYLSEWSVSVEDYIAISSSKHPKWTKYKTSTRQNVETIAEHLRVTQIKPLLFAVAMKFDPDEADKAFKLFVSWSVRFLIVGGRGGLLDTQYAQRAFEVGTSKITKARELRDAMKSVVPADQEFEAAFASARVSKSWLARYYLRSLEKTFKQLPHPEYVANEDVKDINLEHVMPMEALDNWDVDPDTAQSTQKYLGNMVLLREPDNRDLGNKGWDEKKSVLGRSGYELTKMVAKCPHPWDLPDIRKRQTQLAKLAVKTWTLTFDE